jgi:hypothetical protein
MAPLQMYKASKTIQLAKLGHLPGEDTSQRALYTAARPFPCHRCGFHAQAIKGGRPRALIDAEGGWKCSRVGSMACLL